MMSRAIGSSHLWRPSTSITDEQAMISPNEDWSSGRHTSLAINSRIHTGDFHYVNQVSESSLEMNEDVVKIILQCKEDVLKNNKGLSALIDEFLENSVLTLDFSSVLDACLKRTAHLEHITNLALQKFEEERSAANTEEGSTKSYSKTLEEFRNFRRVGDPFNENFFKLFGSVVSHQYLFLKRSQDKKGHLDNKLRKLRVWRKVFNVLFVLALLWVLIFTVFAIFGVVPVITGLLAASTLSVVLLIGWRSSALKKQEKDLIGQREMVCSMQVGLYFVARDLDNLKSLKSKFKVSTGFEDLLRNADFAISTGGEAVAIAVEEKKKKMGRFIEEVHSLVGKADRCNREARMARTLLMRKIIGYPNS